MRWSRAVWDGMEWVLHCLVGSFKVGWSSAEYSGMNFIPFYSITYHHVSSLSIWAKWRTCLVLSWSFQTMEWNLHSASLHSAPFHKHSLKLSMFSRVRVLSHCLLSLEPRRLGWYGSIISGTKFSIYSIYANNCVSMLNS